MINETNHVTMTTNSLLDHFITNKPENISDSGVIHTGISDHILVNTIRKINITVKEKENFIEIRNMKKFDDQLFLEDLLN